MCTQCVSVSDEQPSQQLLLKALVQRALRNTLMTENGTEKLDNELITTLLENITTLAQRVLKEQQRTSHKTRRNVAYLNRSRYPGSHQRYVPLTALLTCSLATLPLLTNAVYSSYDAGTLTKPNRDVTCMAGIPIVLSHASTLSHSRSEPVCTVL